MPSILDNANTKLVSINTVSEQFDTVATRFSDMMAVVDGKTQLSYKELNEQANALANNLLEKISLKNQVVAIVASRSVDCVVAILGVLKSGNAYVFFEPDHPIERINFILKDCSIPVVITNQEKFNSSHAEVIRLDGKKEEVLKYSVKRSLDDLIYIVYTSGSTGTPKGVKISHRSILNYHRGILDKIDFDDCFSFAHLTTFSADLGNTTLYVSLLKGACLHVLTQEIVFTPQKFTDYIRTHNIDCYKSVPSQLTQMADSVANDFLPTKVLISGGEKLSHELVSKLYAAGSNDLKIYNHYGPSETCIGVMTYEVDRIENRGTSIPIGKPITNVRCYVLNQAFKHVGINMIGELYIAGDSLSSGYVNDDALTESKFLKNAIKGEDTIYQTGDVVRILSSGNIEFIRRKDDQVKIKGYRVELGEIEKVVKKHPKVKNALVQYYKDTSFGDMLTAFIKPHQPYLSAINKDENYQLPNGLVVSHLNKNETDYIYHEIFELEAYSKHGISLNKGDVVFDVGANIGMFSLFAHTLESPLKLYAFEPNPEVFNLLNLNLNRYNLDCTLFNMGLSSKTEKKDFSFYTHFSLLSGYYIDDENEKSVIKNYVKNQSSEEQHSDNTLIQRDVSELLEKRFRQKKIIPTQLETLSNIIRTEGITKIDLLKINVEKSELDVLLGIEKDDWRKIKQIVIEIDTDQNYEVIVDLLQSEKFDLHIEKDELLKGTSLCYIFAFSPDFRPVIKDAKDEDVLFYLENNFDDQELKDHLVDYLPYYMMPQKFIFLENFPVTANGKLDRDELLVLFEKNNTVFTSPRNEIEELFAKLLIEILEIEEVSVTENFFIIGMDSIKAIIYVTKLSEKGYSFTIHDVFTYNTIEQLAARAEVAKNSSTPNSSQFIRQSFETFLEEITNAPDERDYYPATFDHRMNWDLFQKYPNSASRNSSFILFFEDANGLAHLDEVLSFLIKRHEALRTTFEIREGELCQVVGAVDAVEVTVEDISKEEEAQIEVLVRRTYAKENNRPFDVARVPTFRAKIIKLTSNKFALLCTSHHITMDGWSVDLLKKEILDCHHQLMNKQAINLPKLAVQFRHYASWKKHLFGTPAINKSEHEFWKSQLSEMESIARLPHEATVHSEEDSIGSEGFLFYFDNTVKSALEKIANKNNSSLYMTLFSAAYLLLYKGSGRKDVSIGMPHVNRNYKEWQGVIGEFAGPIPVRTQLNEKELFSTLLKKVTKNIFEIINRPKYPSLFLKELTQVDFDYQFSLLVGKQNDEAYKEQSILSFNDQHLPSVSNARFEMAMYPKVYGNGIEMTIKFQKRYYSRNVIQRYINLYKEIVSHIAKNEDFQLNKI